MTELMKSGVELMLAGMGIVYLFLIMLVFAINIMSTLVQRYFPDKSIRMHGTTKIIDKSTVAAISAAVHQYRNNNR